MRLFPPLLSYTLLVILSTLVVIRGLIPAFTRIDSDFPNYYTAARIVVDGRALNRLYDDDWFQEQIHSYGMDQQGKFSPFPPATALVMLPVAGLDPGDALRVVTVLNIVLLVGLIVLLSRCLSLHLLDTSVFVLLTGHALINCFRLGQLYLCVSFLLVAAYYAWRKNNPLLAGFCFGLFIPIKYFPIIFVFYFAFQRQWKLVLSALVTILFVLGAGVVVLGWDIHQEYLLSVLGNHLGSHLSLQDPFSATFQSWDSLLRRLMVFDVSMNQVPLFHGNDFFRYVKTALLSIISVVGVFSVKKAHRLGPPENMNMSIAVLGIAGLLLAPATGTYHYLMLLLPLGLFLSIELKGVRRAKAYVILGFHAVIGFIPYSFTRQFDGQGMLTLLAYPRLAALSIMYVLVITTVWKRAQLELET
jgi:hypothetical protein